MAKKLRRLPLELRRAEEEWQELITETLAMSPINANETDDDRIKRVAKLEKEPEEWFRYYFPNYCTAPSAPFHRKATERIVKHHRWYEVRAWSRELAKSSRSMMEIIYLALLGEVHNILLVSTSLDHAIDLLTPFRLHLEHSPRIRQDYGEQVGAVWRDNYFKTTGKVSFRALGAGQSPRGKREEAFRPDFILIDDIDTDEETRSPERIKTKWAWIEKALIPTLSVSGHYRILFNGNIIARDCIITRAIERADHVDIINIRDENGKSTWAKKNSEEDIDRFLSNLSTSAIQQEYFNNPVSEGDVFQEMTWGACPPLRKLPFIVVYGDPSPSNKRGKGASFKALFAMGYMAGKYYVYKGYLQQTTNAEFIGWYYDLREELGDQTVVYYFVENNSLQDPFWEQVLQPLNVEMGAKRGGVVPIKADARAKMDKYARIEATLEPLNRQGRLILNEAERGNPHMKRLEEQFLMIAPSLPAPADGADCIEGGVWQLNRQLTSYNANAVVIGQKSANPKRY